MNVQPADGWDDEDSGEGVTVREMESIFGRRTLRFERRVSTRLNLAEGGRWRGKAQASE